MVGTFDGERVKNGGFVGVYVIGSALDGLIDGVNVEFDDVGLEDVGFEVRVLEGSRDGVDDGEVVGFDDVGDEVVGDPDGAIDGDCVGC